MDELRELRVYLLGVACCAAVIKIGITIWPLIEGTPWVRDVFAWLGV